MNKQDYSNRVVLILAIGIVSIVGAVTIGEMYLSHSRGSDVSKEVFTLIKMSITGMLGIVGGYLGGINARIQARKEEENEDS